MQFSHSVSLVLAAATRSVMKVGHLWGHSCFSTATRMAFSLVMYALSRRKTASSADICAVAGEWRHSQKRKKSGASFWCA